MNKFKNKLSMLLLSSVIIFSSVNVAFGQEKSDKLNKIVELGIIQGEGNGIDSSQVLSRYRGISLQIKLLGLWEDLENYDYNGKETFKDSSQYSPFVQKLLSYIKTNDTLKIQGYPDGTFRPLNSMTVYEFVSIMLSSLGYKNGSDFEWSNLDSFAAEIGLVNSSNDVTSEPITIGKAAEIIYDSLLLEGSKDKEGNFGEEIGFVIKDTRGPQVIFNDIPETTEAVEIKLNGSIDEKGTLKIDGKEIQLNDELKFKTTIPLNVGENIIKTETTDINGNTSNKEYKIERISNELAITGIESNSLKTVKVKFNTHLDGSTVIPENFKLKGLNIGKVQLADNNKSVVVTLDDKSIFNQQDEHTFESIKGLKASNTTSMQDVSNIKFYVSDTEKPVVEKVEMEKNNEIKVTFSEPVKEEQAVDISNYELNGTRFVGTIKGYDYNTVILHSKNIDLKNKLKISNIRDFNNFVMDEQTFEFDYDEDKKGPEIEDVTDVTLESVKLIFNEKIDFNSVNKDNIKWSYTLGTESGKNATDIEKVDDKTIIVYFKGDNSLSPTNVNIIVNGIKDLSGNEIKEDSFVGVKASIDETKPEVKAVTASYNGNASVNSNGITKITVEFTKPVINTESLDNFDNNFIIKDSNGKIIDKKIQSKDYQGKATNIIEFTVNDLSSGEYTLIVKDFKDDTKYPNTMAESECNFKVENKKTPEVTAIYFENNEENDKLYIQYSEPMNDTITDIDNYMIKKNNEWKKLSNETDDFITTKNNNTYAVITLNDNIENYQELEISFVENSVGNVINENKVIFNIQDENIVKNIITMSPSIKYAEITKKNQIKVYLNRELSDAYFKDFWITNHQKEIDQNVYHNKTSELSFNTIPVKESDISTDLNDNGTTNDTLKISVVTIDFTDDIFDSTGKFIDGNEVIILSNPEKILHTADVLGNKLIESSSNAIDKIAPSIITDKNKIYAIEENKKAILKFDEAVNIDNGYEAYAANDIIIKDEENNILTSGIDYTIKANGGNIEITFIKPLITNMTVNSSSSINFIKDLNGNTINKFEPINIVIQ